VIVSELGDPSGIESVQPAVADVSDRQFLAFEDGKRQYAGHTCERRVRLRLQQNLAIRQRDRFAHANVRWRILSLDAPADPIRSDRCGHFSGRLSTNTVDDKEDAGVGIDVEDVLVVIPDPAAVGGPSRFNLHDGSPSR
jgi:hypothetical protein